MKRIFTTTEVAEILQVSNRKVTQWIDSGRLKGFRLPDSTHRRVLKEQLEEFIRDNHLPMELLDASASNASIEQEMTSVELPIE